MAHPPWDEDPDFRNLAAFADPDELRKFVGLARPFLRISGFEEDEIADGEALLQGIYALAASAYSVRGKDDPLFHAAMSFVLNPEKASKAVQAWRQFADLREDQQRDLLEDHRRREIRREREEGS